MHDLRKWNKLALLFLISFIQSCSDTCTVSGICASESLVTNSYNKYFSYCALLGKTLKYDSIALNALVRLHFDGGAGYEHGDVLVKVFRKLGEPYVLRNIRTMDSTDRLFLGEYLDVGLEYSSDSTIREKKLKEVLPAIEHFLYPNGRPHG